MKSVGLQNYMTRPASRLSGGQQQRVALARALVFEPEVILFDEPLSNLDTNLRDQMRNELQELQERIGYTAVYVTHDQREALSLSDEVIVMNSGRIDQIGPPEKIFSFPQTAFTAKFLGCSNIIDGTVDSVSENGYISVLVKSGMKIVGNFNNQKIDIGSKISIAIRANKIQLNINNNDLVGNREFQIFSAVIKSRIFFGTYIEYSIDVGDIAIKVDCDIGVNFNIDQKVFIKIDLDDCLIVRG